MTHCGTFFEIPINHPSLARGFISTISDTAHEKDQKLQVAMW